MKPVILSFIFCLFTLMAYTQRRVAEVQNQQSGKILEYRTNIPLPGVKIENLSLHINAIADSTGVFTIKANVGNIISFSGMGYLPDTVLLINLKFRPFYLTLQQNLLKEVKVVNVEFKQGTFAYKPLPGPFGGYLIRYQVDANGNPKGGLQLNLFDIFKGKGKPSKLEIMERNTEVAKVFNALTVTKYLPIKGQELDNFILLYTPDAKTYYNHNFNLLDYLNTSYKSFLEIPAEKRRSKSFSELK